MKYVNELYNDVLYDSLQNTVRWIEYMIRQNGTPFLRNSLCDETWYRRYNWDVIGFLANTNIYSIPSYSMSVTSDFYFISFTNVTEFTAVDVSIKNILNILTYLCANEREYSFISDK